MADLCLDEYTDHGHCGLLTDDGEVDNDATLELYGEVALAQAEAGADIVAPSGMMDGQVLAIREALDDDGFEQVAILAYAAKYASALYGPFRDAVDVTIAGGGDRKGYQQDPANAREALEEIRLDLGEGADIVMVKPALAYLDVIARARPEVDVPLAAYHVSGEYAMVKAAAERGWIDGLAVGMEHLTVHPAGRRRHDPHLPGPRGRGGPERMSPTNEALFERGQRVIPGGRELAGARLPVRRRHAVLRGLRPRAPRSGRRGHHVPRPRAELRRRHRRPRPPEGRRGHPAGRRRRHLLRRARPPGEVAAGRGDLRAGAVASRRSAWSTAAPRPP